MTTIDDYRRGTSSSTDLMEQSMEQAHAIDPRDREKMQQWTAGRESYGAASDRTRHESDPLASWLLKKTLPAGAVAAETGEGAKAYTMAEQSFKEKLAPAEFRAVQTANRALSVAVRSIVLRAVEPVEAVAVGAVGVAMSVATTVRAFQVGDELHDRSDMDGMELAVVNLLQFDQSFKDAQTDKFPLIVPQHTIALFRDSYGQPTDFGKKHLPELQAAADSGAEAAFTALGLGGKDAYLKSHPEVAKRFSTDVAFNKGFENAIFVSQLKDGGKKLDALRKEVEERNPRSTTPVRVQG